MNKTLICILLFFPCLALFALAGLCIWKDTYGLGLLLAFIGAFEIPSPADFKIINMISPDNGKTEGKENHND